MCVALEIDGGKSMETKAREFVNEVFEESEERRSIRVFHGEDGYGQLIGSKCCSACYIPLPTRLHEEYVEETLINGKHVLLEKPVAVSAKSYRAMLATASRHNKFLLDGTMFVHHQRTRAFAASIPNPNRVTFNFTFDGGPDFFATNIRMQKNNDFLGCIGDLGWYCVRMGILIFSSLDAASLRGLVVAAQVTRCELQKDVPYDADCVVYFSNVSF